MPFYIILILTVLIVGWRSSRWKARWLAWKNAQASSLEGQPSIIDKIPLAARATREFSALRGKFLSRAQQPALAQRFCTWLNLILPADDPLLVWLNSLSAEATTAFTQQVAEFCTEMGFELAALVDGQLGHAPSAEQQATQIVLHYGVANYQAALAGADFTASKHILAYLRSPSSKANRAFGQKLYRKLVDKAVVPPPPFEILLPPEEKRNAQALEAIRNAAAQNPAAFNAALREVLAESEIIEHKEGLTKRLQRAAMLTPLAKFKKTVPAEPPSEPSQPADAPAIIIS